VKDGAREASNAELEQTKIEQPIRRSRKTILKFQPLQLIKALHNNKQKNKYKNEFSTPHL
jgi:hypothetical protein